jgi:hypothetical protein
MLFQRSAAALVNPRTVPGSGDSRFSMVTAFHVHLRTPLLAREEVEAESLLLKIVGLTTTGYHSVFISLVQGVFLISCLTRFGPFAAL